MDINELHNEYRRTYDKGFINHFNRAWFYLEKGMEIVNKTKYVGLYLISLYVALKFTNLWWFALMTVIAVPLLILSGRVYVLKMAKAQEWNNMIRSSYFARYPVDLQEEILKTLKEILNKP